MGKKLIIIAVTITVCIGVILFSQNNDWKNPFEGSDVSDVKYTESKTVNLSMEKVRTLNPITSKDTDTYQISKLIFESLFYLDEDLLPVNGLAVDYQYDTDKKAVTINMRQDAYFSNGDNVTASDVKYSIDNYISAAAYGNTLYSDYVSNIKSVSASKGDRYALTISFKNSSDVSIENLVFPIVSQKSFGKSSGAKMTSETYIPIGSGPYAVEKYNDISELILTANTHYAGVKPQNTIRFTVLPEKGAVIPLLDVNNVAVGFSQDLARDTLISDKKIMPVNFLSNEVEVLGYNFTKSAMANKNVRKAVAYAVDTTALNESAYYKNGVLCDTIYYPGYAGTENTGDNYKFNLEKAKKLLTSANYVDRDNNGYLEGLDDVELNIDILVNGTIQSRNIAAEAIKANLDKLSISCRIIYAASAEEFNSKLQAKEFDIFLGSIKINETYDLRSVLHSGYYNTIGYSNEKLDYLLDKLKSGLNNEQKKETVEEIKVILIEELPYYCIVYKTDGALTAECLAGDSKTYKFNSFYNDCINWYCKYPIKETPETANPNISNENNDFVAE